jgi:Entner-Doudoroff aldolase
MTTKENLTTSQRAEKMLREHGLVAIMRGAFPVDAFLTIGEALAQNGIRVIEITLNSAQARAAIPALRARFGNDLLIGAGTIRRAEQVNEALEVGAQFIVSPNFNPEAVARSQAAGLLHLPGVATPTEAENAFSAGCHLLKLFPADALGGPTYLKVIRAPLDDIDFVPTGGITPENAGEYRRAGAVALGLGSALVSKDWTRVSVTRLARALVTSWKGG